MRGGVLPGRLPAGTSGSTPLVLRCEEVTLGSHVLTAARDIEKGEELLWDYGVGYGRTKSAGYAQDEA